MERSSATKETGKALRKYWPLLLILVVLLITGSISGVLFAKYVTTNKQQIAMVSAGFHMSSDLLETSAVSNLGATDEIVIELYNFEKENNAQISAVDITYTVTVTNGTVISVNNGNAAVPFTEVNKVRYYTLNGGTDRITNTIKIVPDHIGTVTVVVASTAPFVKSLSGTFSFADPTYTIENVEGDLYKLTIYTNGYNGEISIAMDSGVFADRTVDLQENWTSGSQTITVHDNETYELRFFGSVTPTSVLTTLTGAAKSISVGK